MTEHHEEEKLSFEHDPHDEGGVAIAEGEAQKENVISRELKAATETVRGNRNTPETNIVDQREARAMDKERTKSQLALDALAANSEKELIAAVVKAGGIYLDSEPYFTTVDGFVDELNKLRNSLNESALIHSIDTLPATREIKVKLRELFVVPQNIASEQRPSSIKVHYVQPAQNRSLFSRFANLFRSAPAPAKKPQYEGTEVHVGESEEVKRAKRVLQEAENRPSRRGGFLNFFRKPEKRQPYLIYPPERNEKKK